MNPKDLEAVTASEKTKRPGREADRHSMLVIWPIQCTI